MLWHRIWLYFLWKWKSFSTLCDSMDYKVHGILQARILEWMAVPFSRVSFLNPGLLHWRQILYLYLIPGYGSEQTCWLPLLTIAMNSSVYHSRKYQAYMGRAVVCKVMCNISSCSLVPLSTPPCLGLAHFSPWWDWLGQAWFGFLSDSGLSPLIERTP